jgi:flavin-dependent dehydrogenase
VADYDAIIIGSGAGGLAAAIRLALLKFTVLLLEATPSFGVILILSPERIFICKYGS